LGLHCGVVWKEVVGVQKTVELVGYGYLYLWGEDLFIRGVLVGVTCRVCVGKSGLSHH